MARRHRVALATALAAAFGVERATAPPPLPGPAEVRAAWRPSEAYLLDRHGRLLDTERVDFAVRRLAWTPLAAVSPRLAGALVAAEDRRFDAHGGVDLIAVAAGLRARLLGERPRGASTITMQLAAMLAPELGPGGGRSVRQKITQARAGWRLERNWSKPQILEAYLNLLGYRGELQGIAAASHALAGKSPASLTTAESLTLAALLPAPQASAATVAARACRLGRAARADCGQLARTAAEMLARAGGGGGDPGLAPHLARRLLREPGARVVSTLDAGLQRLATRALARQLGRLSADTARDGSVVVVDNASGDVLAYVGGAGALSRAADVDKAAAPRQAGSTLKPFVYALAIERGYLTAASILDDSPVNLDTASGLYVPQNYDRVFRGPVSARTALGNSLNVPAVRAALLVGVEPLRDRLWDAGYRGLVEAGDFYGFSLALGSAEVTLLEQAAAYRTLARGGLHAPLRLSADAPAPPARRVLDAPAAAIVADMLADPGARSLTFGTGNGLALPFWAAVKTGTSKAMRDNWCVGFSERFTVAVWVGNAEGDPMRGVSGVAGAAPVWREVMLALHAGSPGRRPAMPPGVVAARVRFVPAIEPARREWFVAGSEQPEFALVGPSDRAPRILNPVAGTVLALDPDIPPDRQRFQFRAHGTNLRLVLDGRDLGPARAAPLWSPTPGAHRLQLADARGREHDSVRFSVR